jgi:hypothetical protein
MIKGSGVVIANDDTRCFVKHESVNCYLLEDDGALKSLMLMTKLECIEDVSTFSNEEFNLPCNADLERLIFGSIDAMDEAEIFRTVVSRIFLDCNIVAFEMSVRCKIMGDWHLHQA